MQKVLSLILMGLIVIATAFATVTVSGENITELKPDIIYLSFYIEKEGLTAQESQEFHKKVVTNVLDVLQKNEIQPERIKSDNYLLYPVYPEDKKEKMLYYSGIRVTVEVYQVSELGQLIDKVLAVGNTRIEKISFDLKSLSAAKVDALKQALQDAKAKAELMAGELNLKTAQAVSVNEKTEVIYDSKKNEFGLFKNKSNDISEFPSNKILVRSQVNVVFETLPKE